MGSMAGVYAYPSKSMLAAVLPQGDFVKKHPKSHSPIKIGQVTQKITPYDPRFHAYSRLRFKQLAPMTT
jgi:hypothetical protein